MIESVMQVQTTPKILLLGIKEDKKYKFILNESKVQIVP